MEANGRVVSSKIATSEGNSSGLFWPSLVGCIVSIESIFIFFFVSIYLKELNISGLGIGTLFAILNFTAIITAFPMGLSNDYLTPKRMIAISLVVFGSAIYAMAVVKSYWLFVAIFLIYGLSSNLFRLSLDVLMLKIFKGFGKGRAIGIYQGVRSFGLALGTFLGGFFIAKFGFERSLIYVAILTLAAIAFVPKLPNYPATRASLVEYRKDSFNPRALFLFLWVAIFGLHWGAEATSFGLFLKEWLKLPYSLMGIYMTLEVLVLAVTIILVGIKYDKGIDEYKWLYAGLFISGVGMTFMVTHNFWASISFRALHGVGDGILTIVMYLKISELFSSERMGGNSGLFLLAQTLGNAVGAIMFGHIGQTFGYHVPMILSGAIIVFLIFPILLSPKSWKA